VIFTRDFDALSEGDRFTTSGRTITEADLVSFASLTGDWHPQHADAEWAGESRFGERIAHGMLVMSYAVGLVPLDPERVLALRRIGDVTFKQPVCIGDTIHVDGRIESLRPLAGDVGLVETGWKIINQRSKIVARARVEVVWRRAAEPAAPAEEPESHRALVVPL
jgi:3-hydroxybutyryl-CoA dehydratase